jgi:CheY-like chemotaxis protein
VAKLGKILVVEDDPHARQGLSDLLNAWGYETDTASDGAEGLEKVAAFNPAVVISDLRMPQVTGMELLRQLHDARPGPALHHADGARHH